MKAWLVTWESHNEHAAREPKILDILSARKRPQWVREYVERLHLVHLASLRERSEYARYNNPSDIPYPAEFARAAGGTYQGRIYCGHDPRLFARLVDNFRVDDDGVATWDEIPMPEIFKHRRN